VDAKLHDDVAIERQPDGSVTKREDVASESVAESGPVCSEVEGKPDISSLSFLSMTF
jgi:hypothetical protein